MATDKKYLKNRLGELEITVLATALSTAWPPFEKLQFIHLATTEIEKLELRQRVDSIIDALHCYLPQDFKSAAQIIDATGRELSQLTSLQHFEFIAWPLIDYVGVYGRNEPKLALPLLEQLTHLFTAEFAIRPFIQNQFDSVLPFIKKWTKSENEHVRRLASEGLRPRLPWGGYLRALQSDPSPILPILELLRDDESLYVRKSVANNLNDISKDHPELVLQLCQDWLCNATQNRKWIIKRGLRSLVKQGHPEVFPLLGYSETTLLKNAVLSIDKPTINIGSTILLTVALVSNSTKQEHYVIDYCIHHVGSDGKIRTKVYKWKNAVLQPKQQLRLRKKHAFKQLSTRTYYPGMHMVDLIINGQMFSRVEVMLEA